MASTPTFPSVPAGTSSITMNTGKAMPLLGLGTWRSPHEQVVNAVVTALRNGVRHIDGALIYGNEEGVGEGIRTSGVPREEIFVTTKLWSTYHTRVQEGIDISLKKLGLDYVDLYLMHWPIALEVHGDHPFPQREDGSRALDTKRKVSETWADMEKYALATGKAKAIGVSNVSQPVMEELLAAAKTVPAANQIETHPFLPEHDLVRYLQSKNIVPQAYSPLGSAGAPVLDDEVIVSIAKAKGVQPGQVAISWQAQRGVAVLPKSVTESRIIANGKQISLTDDEMKQINELYLQPGKLRRTCMPAWGVDLKFDNYPPPGQLAKV